MLDLEESYSDKVLKSGILVDFSNNEASRSSHSSENDDMEIAQSNEF